MGSEKDSCQEACLAWTLDEAVVCTDRGVMLILQEQLPLFQRAWLHSTYGCVCCMFKLQSSSALPGGSIPSCDTDSVFFVFIVHHRRPHAPARLRGVDFYARSRF